MITFFCNLYSFLKHVWWKGNGFYLPENSEWERNPWNQHLLTKICKLVRTKLVHAFISHQLLYKFLQLTFTMLHDSFLDLLQVLVQHEGNEHFAKESRLQMAFKPLTSKLESSTTPYTIVPLQCPSEYLLHIKSLRQPNEVNYKSTNTYHKTKKAWQHIWKLVKETLWWKHIWVLFTWVS